MNFLGHSFFKEGSSLFLLGNVCGDFYKGLPHTLSLPEEMIEGIKFHRRLDSLTDSTSAVEKAKRALSAYGLYSGIIVDIYYDHFLSKNWKLLKGESLELHCEYLYSELSKNVEYIPAKSRTVVDHMIEENWFENYGDLEFIEKTLSRISRRISRENNVDKSIHNLRDNYSFFQENFFEFWRELEDKINKL